MTSFISSEFSAGDGFMYIWNIYNFWQQLLSGHNPFFTKAIFYPIGVNLAFHDYSPLTSLLLGIFRNSYVVGINVLILLSFVLTSFSAFLLIKFITRNYSLSVVAGLVYGFSPIMFSFLLTEHYYLLAGAFYLPLGILSALRFWQKKSLVAFLPVILLFWLIFITASYMFVIYILAISIFFLIKALIYFFDKDTNINFYLLKTVLILVIFLAVLPLMFFFSSILHLNSQKYNIYGSFSANACNADLLGYVIPNQSVSYLQNFSLQLSSNLGYQPRADTPSYYIGLFYLILATVTFVKFRKNSSVAVIGSIGIIFFLLSLGTKIRIGDIIIFEGWLTPFYWFSQLPFLGFVGCPVRFSIVALLSVIFLSYFLINQIIKKFKLPNLVICTLLASLFFIEYGIPQIKLIPVAVPEVYQRIAKQSNSRAILELPSGLTESYGYFGYDYSIPGLHAMQMYWQTIHQKPRIGGFISRIPQTTYSFFRKEQIISDIFEMTNYKSQSTIKQYVELEVNEFVKKFNLGYIVFSPNEKQNRYLEEIENLFKGIPYQKDYYIDGFILLTL